MSLMIKIKRLGIVSALALVGSAVFSFTFADSLVLCPGNSGIKASENFVYCGPASCKPSADGETAACDCSTMSGPNWGTTSCSDRVPHGNQWISSFTARTGAVEGKAKQPIIFCDVNQSGGSSFYADCLNATCVVDQATGRAVCQCALKQLEHGSVFATQTQSCNLPDKCHAPSGFVLNGVPAPIIMPLVKMINETTGQSLSDLTCDSYKNYSSLV